MTDIPDMDPAENVDAQLRGVSDPGLRSALQTLAKTLEERHTPGVESGQDVEERQARAVQLQLPIFAEALALPNAFLRAALFPVLDSKRPRQFVKKLPVFAVGDLEVTFTGEQFDQGDLDVLAGILEIGSPVELGNEFRFSSYQLLKLLGKPTGGKEYAWLHETLIRLNGGTVEVKKKRRLFFGSFIEGGFEDKAAKEYSVRINPKLGVLFGFDMWSQVDREQRRALGRNGTAKALHGYYSSHVEPGPHRYETLAAIAGLQNKQKADLKRKVVKAHEALKSPKCGFLEGYEAGPETITVRKRKATTSQGRHALKQPAKRSKKKKTNR